MLESTLARVRLLYVHFQIPAVSFWVMQNKSPVMELQFIYEARDCVSKLFVYYDEDSDCGNTNLTHIK